MVLALLSRYNCRSVSFSVGIIQIGCLNRSRSQNRSVEDPDRVRKTRILEQAVRLILLLVASIWSKAHKRLKEIMT